MGYNTFPVGSRVRTLSYGPFRGLKGTVRKVDCILYLDEPVWFYHIELEGVQIEEPLWFAYDEIELIGAFESIFISA